MKKITAAALKPTLTDGAEIAFLDVREHGQYGEGHPFFCVNLPYSVIEDRAPVLVPCKDTRCMLLDDGDGVADRAATVLEAMGYTNLLILDGGAPAWADAGFALFKGVNVPSKTFGELVEKLHDTPLIAAEELKAMQDSSDPFVLLDGRSPAEFNKMSLPGARSCPNAELGYRLPLLVEDDKTPIIVNCAGRTRSIIGAQTLRNLGVRNPVYALRNGTQGWRLAGFELHHGEEPGRLPQLDETARGKIGAQAENLIRAYGLKTISPETLAQWQSQAGRTTYLLDVRTLEEFEAAHWQGARHAPGGQLVQATDEFFAVRNARIVLSDDLLLRAATTAIWLRGMGHDACILNVDASKGEAKSKASAASAQDGSILSLEDIPALVSQGALLLDASRGMDFRRAHIAGAEWVTRARVAHHCELSSRPVIVTGRDRVLVQGVVADLAASGMTDIHHHVGSPADWKDAGLEVVATPDTPGENECIDHLFFVHDRHDGNLEAARRYLEWEVGLLDQLDEQDRSVLKPLEPALLESV
jgi:rhodanese-related sulfurtransferase